MILRQRIRECRERKGWTQAELAERLNKSRQAIGAWESEKATAEPSAEELAELAKLFGVSTDYLLGRTDLVTTVWSAREMEDGTIEETVIVFPPEAQEVELQARREAERLGVSFSEYVITATREKMTRR